MYLLTQAKQWGERNNLSCLGLACLQTGFRDFVTAVPLVLFLRTRRCV